MRALRISLGAAAALALLSAAPAARAGGGVPAYGALPTGRLTTVPTTKAPAFIPAREQVAGLFIVSPKFSPEMPVDARHVTIVADAKQAEAIRADRGSGRASEDDAGACFAESHRSMRGAMMGRDAEDGGDDDDLEWTTSQMWQLNLWLKSKNNPQAGVTAVHSERIVTTSGKTALEMVDAWVDPATHGARLISRSSLALEPVGSAIGGVKVYAARDDRANGKRFVQFVLVREGGSAAGRNGTMMGMRQDGTGVHGSGCGHLRMPLVVEANAGDSGVVMAPVELPAAKGESARKAKDDGGKGAGTASAGEATPAPTFEPVIVHRKGLGPKTILRRITKQTRPTGPERPAPEPREREARLRDMQVHLSVSQTSRDKEPILSVAFGWAGRESVQRVFDAPPGEGGD